jgi:hypothetical protein
MNDIFVDADKDRLVWTNLEAWNCFSAELSPSRWPPFAGFVDNPALARKSPRPFS